MKMTPELAQKIKSLWTKEKGNEIWELTHAMNENGDFSCGNACEFIGIEDGAVTRMILMDTDEQVENRNALLAKFFGLE